MSKLRLGTALLILAIGYLVGYERGHLDGIEKNPHATTDMYPFGAD